MEQTATPEHPKTAAKAKNQSVLQYLALRTLLLILVAAVLYLLGLRGIWWIVAAFLLSGLISLFVLSGQRDVAAGSLESAFSRLNRRINRAAAAEDELLEEQRASGGPANPATPNPAVPEPVLADPVAADPVAADPVDAAAKSDEPTSDGRATGHFDAAVSAPKSQPASDSGVGVQAASHEVDSEEVDQEGRKGD